MKQEREAHREERLQALAKAAKMDITKLGPRKSAHGKVRLAAALKRSTSVSIGWLAARLAMGKSASVSRFTKRYLLSKDGPVEINAILSRIKT